MRSAHTCAWLHSRTGLCASQRHCFDPAACVSIACASECHQEQSVQPMLTASVQLGGILQSPKAPGHVCCGARMPDLAAGMHTLRHASHLWWTERSTGHQMARRSASQVGMYVCMYVCGPEAHTCCWQHNLLVYYVRKGRSPLTRQDHAASMLG